MQITPLQPTGARSSYLSADGRLLIERQRVLGRSRWRVSLAASGDEEAAWVRRRAGTHWRTRGAAVADLELAARSQAAAGRIRPLSRHKRRAWRSEDGLLVIQRGAGGWLASFYSPQAYMAMPDARYARLLGERWPSWTARHGLDQPLPLAETCRRLQTAVEVEPLATLWAPNLPLSHRA